MGRGPGRDLPAEDPGSPNRCARRPIRQLPARFDSSPLGVEGLDADINDALDQMWQGRNRAAVLTTRLMARNILTARPDAAYLDLQRDDESPGRVDGVCLRNAAGEVIVEDTLEWECEAQGRPDIDYLTSQLDADSPSWMQFSKKIADEDGLALGDQTYRLDLRAASNAVA